MCRHSDRTEPETVVVERGTASNKTIVTSKDWVRAKDAWKSTAWLTDGGDGNGR
jgi:tetraacyldisaccharide-1-P 4'-kinase